MYSKIIFFSFLMLFGFSQSYGQLGVSTATPEGMLDVPSSDNGVLLPRIALTSTSDNTTVVNPQGVGLVAGTIVFNTGTGGLTQAGYYYWSTTGYWTPMFDNNIDVYTGEVIITSAGVLSITDVPFPPKNVRFTMYANTDALTLNVDNGVGNGNGSLNNSFGYMRGYAQELSGVIDQQVICGGGSGNSINDISLFASPLHCVGLRYGGQNGGDLGTTSAILTSFTGDGFELNVDSFADNVVIIYEAHRN